MASGTSGSRLPLCLTAFGLPHVMGYLATRSGERASPPLEAFGLMDAAVELGLSGIEAPLPALTGAPLDAWCDALAARRLGLVADLPVPLDAEPSLICGWLEAAARLGASVVRTTLSSILCGDRRSLPGGIVSQNDHELLPGIEIAAQATRTIPLLAADWWACYPPVSATELLPLLRLIWERARPRSEPYASAWEQGKGSREVQAEEWDLVRRSALHFRALFASGSGSEPAQGAQSDLAHHR
ncbi:MAG: hypothetical protein ABI895_20480 [Deltaproteobacteria bacterium]